MIELLLTVRSPTQVLAKTAGDTAMPSNAYENLGRRMNDINQLLQAHTALTQFQRAQKAAKANKAGSDLAKIGEVVASLVSEPGRGRRTEVDALNRAAIVLLSAHLQGYIEDLFTETARFLLEGSVKDVNVLIKQGLSNFSNPHTNRIDQLFASIGLSEVTNSLSWQKASNQAIKKRLSGYIETRNAIVHGKQAGVDKAKVTQFKHFVELFAENLDEQIGKEARKIKGKKAW